MTKPTEQYVYLIPQRDNGGKVSGWNWLYNGDSGDMSNYPTIAANNGKNEIYFTIVDPLKQIQFAGHPTDVNQALYLSEKGSPTAKKPGIIVDKQDFDSPSLINGTKLHLGDANGRVKEFVYQLNFVDTQHGNQSVVGIDPEIRNGDGSPFFQNAVIYLGVAVGVALLTLVFARFALGWR